MAAVHTCMYQMAGMEQEDDGQRSHVCRDDQVQNRADQVDWKEQGRLQHSHQWSSNRRHFQTTECRLGNDLLI